MTAKIIDKQTAEHYLWGDNCDSWILADTIGLSCNFPTNNEERTQFLHLKEQAIKSVLLIKGTVVYG